jgi:hypothetical protein
MLSQQGEIGQADRLGGLDQCGMTRPGADGHRQALAQRQFCDFGA